MALSKILLVCCFVASLAAADNPALGRWNFNIGARASWLGITEKNGALEVWYQPTGGNVYQIKDVRQTGSHLSLTVS